MEDNLYFESLKMLKQAAGNLPLPANLYFASKLPRGVTVLQIIDRAIQDYEKNHEKGTVY